MYNTDLRQTSSPVALPDGWVHYFGIRQGQALYALHNTIDDLWLEYTTPITPTTLAQAKVTLTKTKKG